MILVVNVAGWHLWNAAVGTWTLEELLPLHLCSAALPVVALALVLRHHLLAAGSWLLAAPGALQAILTPEVAPYGFPHYRVLQSWLAHGGLFLAGAWLVFAEGLRPTLRHVVQWWLILHAYAAVVYGINAAIGSNYLFLNHKPEFASILDALPAWPWYLLILEALVAAFMLLFWAIGRRWRRSRTTAA